MTEHMYYVVSPEIELYPGDAYGTGDPPEWGCEVEQVRAKSKREAKRLGVPLLKKWVAECREDGRNPFVGVKVELPVCPHRPCICEACSPGEDCPECIAELTAEAERDHPRGEDR